MPGQLCASRYTRVEVRYTYKHIQGQIKLSRYTQTELRCTYIYTQADAPAGSAGGVLADTCIL